MKILYLTNQFYLHGGIEKILSQKINYLIKNGYEVVLCTSEHQNNNYVYPLPDGLKHIDLKIDYVRSKSYFHPKNLIKSLGHFKSLKKLIQKEQPDVVISVNFTPEQYFLPFIAKKIPKVKELHASGVNLRFKKNIIGNCKKQLFNLLGRYDCIVVLNKDEKQYYTFKTIRVIPNFLHLENNHPKTFKKEKTIIAAGRIAPVKQFDQLIKAWAKIAPEFPNWQVKIFGEGDQNIIQELEQQIAKLKINNIRLMGATNRLQEEMHKASIFAMTSATECFPMVLLEAQAAGMAIVAYDCPNGPRNIIDDGFSGILTSLDSISDFAATLKKIMKDDEKRIDIGVQSLREVKQFSQRNIMGMWEDLFKNLTN